MYWKKLIPILFFLLPLVISFLDKRAKKRKGIPPVKAAPIDPASPLPSASERMAPGKTGLPGIPKGGAVSSERLPDPAENGTEGERAILRNAEKKDDEGRKPKLEIDKKKLILYSEILKPKFDA